LRLAATLMAPFSTFGALVVALCLIEATAHKGGHKEDDHWQERAETLASMEQKVGNKIKAASGAASCYSVFNAGTPFPADPVTCTEGNTGSCVMSEIPGEHGIKVSSCDTKHLCDGKMQDPITGGPLGIPVVGNGNCIIMPGIGQRVYCTAKTAETKSGSIPASAKCKAATPITSAPSMPPTHKPTEGATEAKPNNRENEMHEKIKASANSATATKAANSANVIKITHGGAALAAPSMMAAAGVVVAFTFMKLQ